MSVPSVNISIPKELADHAERRARDILTAEHGASRAVADGDFIAVSDSDLRLLKQAFIAGWLDYALVQSAQLRRPPELRTPAADPQDGW